MEDKALVKQLQAQRRARVKARDGSGFAPWARCGNLALGIWLQASVPLWPHGDASRTCTWFVGLFISIIALLSMGSPPMRWLNAFLSVALLVLTFATTGSEPLTYMNGMVCGVLVFALSLVPTRSAATDFQD